MWILKMLMKETKTKPNQTKIKTLMPMNILSKTINQSVG